MVIIGFDTEFTSGDREEPEAPQGSNHLLCYSFAVQDTTKEGGISGGFQIEGGKDRRKRLTLNGFLAKVIHRAIQKGYLDRAPGSIVMVAHFNRADLCGFKDWPKIKRSFDAVRSTYTTTTRPTTRTLWLPGGKKVLVTVILLDTMLLAPAGLRSLKKLGELLDFPKIDLPPGAIERMDLLRDSDPGLFEEYARRDAEIAVTWVVKILEFLDRELGIDRVIVRTLSAAAVQSFVSMCLQRGYDLDTLLGQEPRRSGSRKRQFTARVADVLSFLADCYHGGRNEAYGVGYSRIGEITDIDIAGAYPTAMAAIRMPDWEKLCETTDLDRLAHVGAMTFARVKFRFPAEVRFPSLPVRAGPRGLVYPRECVSYCTGPELVVAQAQGAQLVIERGVIVPWSDLRRPFSNFTQKINEIREAHQRGTVFERTAKEIGNSLYGKIAQGVADMRSQGSGKRVFESRTGEMTTLPPSKITQPGLAAYTTGLVRALVSELLARLPASVEVYNATTDGFLSTARLEDVDTSGPVASFFAEQRKYVAGTEQFLDVKHRVGQIIIVKTRGTYTVRPHDKDDPGVPVLARAGQRFERKPENTWEECARWIELYRSRTYDLKHQHRVRIDQRTQWHLDADLVDIERAVRVNLDFDFKRRLVSVTEREGVLAAETEPWRTVDEFHAFRDDFETWKKTYKRVLKTPKDFDDFLRWRSEKFGRKAAGTNARTNIPTLATAFLRAWSRQDLELPGGDYSKVARQMTEAGWPVTVDNFKNARRRGNVPVGRISALTSEDELFVLWALSQWPEWEVEALANPESQAAARIEELRCRCQTSYLGIGRMTPQERSNSGTGAISTQASEYADENEIGVILPEKHDSDPRQERSQPFLTRGPGGLANDT